MDLFPVIMAGGSGTRFWPQSRKAWPKQFLPLVSALPLIAETAARLPPLATLKETFVVCGKVHAPVVKKLLKGLPAKNLLVEPLARNTAPAIALAAIAVHARNPEGILAVLPSDQAIADVPGFRAALARAAAVAKTGACVTLGIQPTRPETGYGYIQQGSPLAGQDGVFEVKAFVEKPKLDKAKEYLAQGGFLWNAGIFLFRADVMLGLIREHLPEMAAGVDKLQQALAKKGEKGFAAAVAREFPRFPSISIDYGVMEKTKNIAVVPASVGWSDVGSFAALPEVRTLDADKNVIEGMAFTVDVKDSVVLARKDRPLAVIGVEGLVVVDAGDAILVCPKDRAQDVRKIVEALEKQGKKKFL